jgi:hypothetical protein
MAFPTTFVAGDILEAQQLNDNFNYVSGDFTSYTPTVTGWTIGNGTITGKYATIGQTVFLYGNFLFGSTSAVAASSTLTITLPVAQAAFSTPVEGSCNFYDVSAGVNVAGFCETSGTTAAIMKWFDPETAPLAVRTEFWNTSMTLPFTFATGDYVWWTIMYGKA